MGARADRIENILQQNGGRLSVSDILEHLSAIEKVEGMKSATVSSTVSSDNNTRIVNGMAKRFRTYGDGDEVFGSVSLAQFQDLSKDVVEATQSPYDQLTQLVEKTNSTVRQQLKRVINELSWREFESNFLSQVLEALGFENVEITQPTGDGGKDAICAYRRGIVTSQAIVSAKHWTSLPVGPGEVQRLRGITDTPADTGVIVTSSHFTKGAIKEAEPVPNFRTVVLIDGDLIVDTCLRIDAIHEGLGIQKVGLPQLFRMTERLASEEEALPGTQD